MILRRNELHLELTVDKSHQVGRQHHAGVADAVLESAITTIVDLGHSISTVDGADKVDGYRTWLGLLTGDLTVTFRKGGEQVTRTEADNRVYTAPDGASELVLSGRALPLIRNVGHHMRTDAVRTSDGQPVLEACLDILVSAVAALHDLRGLGRFRNFRSGSFYVLKPKMHGPDEVGLAVDLFAAVEEALGLDSATIKIGIMDEERRTSLNLEACIARAHDRVIFVNTGFLDRTGDEIHTIFEAGPVVRKEDQRSATWSRAYEDRNVEVVRTGPDRQRHVGPAGQHASNARHQGRASPGWGKTNVQSILGYVVRWVGLGIGCSTVPDLKDVGLMEDRATLRISSQEIANWLRHGLVDEAQVRETFSRMAVLVDEQNAGEPGYEPMIADPDTNPSFQAALEPVLAGREEPNGYTERVLTGWRNKVKA